MEANSNEAMREALSDILDRIDKWRTDGSMEHWQYSQLFDIADAALALPRRQCDVGTAEEQLLRFEKHCNNYNEYCDGCPLPQIWHRGDMIGKCRLAWAQMPYTESEATDGK